MADATSASEWAEFFLRFRHRMEVVGAVGRGTRARVKKGVATMLFVEF
jgi:hypothetical protein